MTGGSRGIGAAIAERLAAPDRLVFLNYYRNEAAAAGVRDRLRGRGAAVEIVQADMADREAVFRMMDMVGRETGRLDMLVHCAAPPLAPKRLMKLNWEADILPQMMVGCAGFLHCIQAAKAFLGEDSRVAVLLTDALFHKPPVQMGAYLAAKGALWGLVRAAAKELQAQRVFVNAVSPGMTQTELLSNYGDRALELFAEDHPLRRLARPEEVAAAVESLLTGGYIHGANLIVNGGTEF